MQPVKGDCEGKAEREEEERSCFQLFLIVDRRQKAPQFLVRRMNSLNNNLFVRPVCPYLTVPGTVRCGKPSAYGIVQLATLS